MPRFVVLYHAFPPGSVRASHWDFMLEFGGALRTWALEVEPADAQPIAAQRLPDHRLAYLEYEGLLSEGRGEVSRWDQGRFQVQSESADGLVCTLHGGKLRGTATLTAGRPDEARGWTVQFALR